MKRLIKQILSISLILTILTVYTPIEVNALSNTDLGCDSQYELSTANADGTFTVKECYSSFYSAREAMTDENDVVRHESSLSPMKIVAMQSGVGYTYPNRNTVSDNSLTTTFYQYIYSGKTTSTTRYREFIYYSTGEYDGDGHGAIYVAVNGFKGYADIYEVDLIPQIFIDNNVIVTLGGNDSGETDGSGSYEVEANRSYYSIEENGNYTDLVFTWYSGRPGYDSNSMPEYSHNISVAPDFMEEGVKYYSNNGYDFYADINFDEKIGTYYPYYVYLPLRTESDITATQIDNYANSKLGSIESVMKNIGESFTSNQETYGINALLTFSMGWHESGRGTSSIAISKNNLFGWNAVDTSPGESANYYEDVETCVRDHMAMNLRGFIGAFSWKYFGTHLGNKGSGLNVKYATDPYWGYKIAAYAYDIDKFSNNYDGTLTDYDKYDLYVAPIFGSKLYKTDSFETKLYSLDYGGIYQEANIQTVLEETDEYFKVQSTNIVDSSGEVVKHYIDDGLSPITDYDWNISVGYMKLNELVKINNFEDDNTGNQAEGDFVLELSNFSLVDNKISISGTAYQPGIWLEDVNSLTHYLYITDEENVEQLVVELLQANSGVEHYEASNFVGLNIDISSLDPDKSYNLAIKTVGEKYTDISNIITVTSVIYKKENIEYDLVSDNEHTVLNLTSVNDVSPSPSPTPTSTPTPGDTEENYFTWLDSYNISSDGIISFDGYAFVTGKDNGEGNISHKIEVIDLDDGNVVETIIMNTTTGEQDISDWFVDDYDYSYAYFNGTVDVSDYALSEYKFNLVTTVEGDDYEEDIRVQHNSSDSEIIEVNNRFIQLNKEYYYKYRLELTISETNLFADKSELPTRMESSIYISGMTYDENSDLLRIAGDAFIWKADFDLSNNPQYRLYLINIITGDEYYEDSLALANLNGMYSEDLTSVINKKFNTDYNYQNIWFDMMFDISEIPEGNYTGVLRVSTDDLTDYIDLKTNASISMIDYSSDELSLNTVINEINKNKVKIYITRN